MMAASEDRETELANVIRLGVFVADEWHSAHRPWTGTQAGYIRGLVENSVRHLVERGLLRLTDDAGQRLAGWVPVERGESSEPQQASERADDSWDDLINQNALLMSELCATCARGDCCECGEAYRRYFLRIARVANEGPS